MRRVVIASVAGLSALLALSACQKKSAEPARTGDAAATTATAAATPAGPLTPPPRKPGLWVQKINAMGRTQEMRLCIDAATDKELSAFGAQMGKEMCEKQVITPMPGGWKFESVCSVGAGGGKSHTVGTVTGDFSSNYKMEAKVSTEGSSMPQANATRDMTMEASWSGPCPAGMKPGDMAMNVPGMGMVNIAGGHMTGKK